MEKNAYFEICNKDDGMYLKVIEAVDGGSGLHIDDVIYYLDTKHILEYDIKCVNEYIARGDFSKELKLNGKRGFPINEHLKLEIDDYGKRVVARFYAPTNDGAVMSVNDILRELKLHGVVAGIKLRNIQIHLKARLYCTDILIASAIPPVHGHDAKIEYFFKTDIASKPKLNEDGTVDFHDLGNISHINKGDRLAHLTPEDPGIPGKDVFGQPIMPKKVKRKILKHGRNISLSPNKLDMFSEVSGHVTLSDDTVFVSDTYDVPNNVDASTGDIEYTGNVNIKGNVNTGYSVKASGDITVEGIVEGATLVAGGDIILRLGVQGMYKAKLDAGGSIISRFIENCELVNVGGNIYTDAILHSEVRAKGEIEVKGKRGLISGGHVMSACKIKAKTVGNNLETQTLLEVGISPERMEEYHSLENNRQECIEENEIILEKLENYKKRIKSGAKINEETMKQINEFNEKFKYNENYIEKAKKDIDVILEELNVAKHGSVTVSDTANAGVTITIDKVKYRIKDVVSHIRFVKEGADIKQLPY